MDRSDYHSSIILPFLRDHYKWPDDIADRYARAMQEAHQMVCSTDTGGLMDMRAALPNVFDMAITYSYVNPHVMRLSHGWVNDVVENSLQRDWAIARQAFLRELLDYTKARMNKDPKYRTYDSEVFATFYTEVRSVPGLHRREHYIPVEQEFWKGSDGNSDLWESVRTDEENLSDEETMEENALGEVNG